MDDVSLKQKQTDDDTDLENLIFNNSESKELEQTTQRRDSDDDDEEKVGSKAVGILVCSQSFEALIKRVLNIMAAQVTSSRLLNTRSVAALHHP